MGHKKSLMFINSTNRDSLKSTKDKNVFKYQKRNMCGIN